MAWVGLVPTAPHASQRGFIVCGPRVTICSVGKTKESWLQSAIELYTKRLRPVLDIELSWVKDDVALEAAVRRVGSTTETCIILDERGSQCSSVEFANVLYEGLEAGGSRLNFFIGGAEGLPPSLKTDPRKLMSLSKMTFTHQMARLLLIEQV